MLNFFGRKPRLNVAFVGDYLPRVCGIATFTADLCETVSRGLTPVSNIFTVAVNDNGKSYNYPPRVAFTVEQSQQKDYFEAANFINTSNADIDVKGRQGDFLLDESFLGMSFFFVRGGLDPLVN